MYMYMSITMRMRMKLSFEESLGLKKYEFKINYFHKFLKVAFTIF